MSNTALENSPVATPAAISIRPFEPADAPAFYSLNEQWISEHFGMEDRDELNLGNPRQSILDPGGRILMAVAGGRPIGCCALIPEPTADGSPATEYELAKMAVSPEFRGQGLGRQILLATVDLARSVGARRLILGSNSRLANAVHLYETIGFHHVPVERRPTTLYARCNVFMEMFL